jgi:hypothetical protein
MRMILMILIRGDIQELFYTIEDLKSHILKMK